MGGHVHTCVSGSTGVALKWDWLLAVVPACCRVRGTTGPQMRILHACCEIGGRETPSQGVEWFGLLNVCAG